MRVRSGGTYVPARVLGALSQWTLRATGAGVEGSWVVGRAWVSAARVLTRAARREGVGRCIVVDYLGSWLGGDRSDCAILSKARGLEPGGAERGRVVV